MSKLTARPCPHRSLITGALIWVYQPALYRKEVAIRQCKECSAYLGMGPARMTPECEVELRAVQIAEDEAEMGRMMTGPIDHEVLGYILRCQAEKGFAFDKHCTNGSQLAGYLARCIATHDEER